MWKLLIAVACLVLASFLVAGTVAAYFFSNWRFHRLARRSVPTVCITCQGKGLIREQERTLRFEGDAFVDGAVHTRPCPVCGGTGTVHR